MTNKLEKRIGKIETHSENTVVQFTQTIDKLNADNVELTSIFVDIEEELRHLNDAQDTIQLRVKKNETVIQGLKNVLENG